MKRDKLSAERAKRLTTAGFDWNPHSTSWEEGFGFLKRFASREGHTNVSQTHLEDDYRLGIWVSTQRRLRNRGDLSSERRERLTSLGLSWDMMEEAWEEGFAHLERFVNRKGHANVPARYIDPADNYRLGSWVTNQRQAHKRASLSAEVRDNSKPSASIGAFARRNTWDAAHKCRYVRVLSVSRLVQNEIKPSAPWSTPPSSSIHQWPCPGSLRCSTSRRFTTSGTRKDGT